MRSNSVSDSRYRLRCTACGAYYSDDGARIACDYQHKPALLRSVYVVDRFLPGSAATIARYERWLPAGRQIVGPGRAGVFRSSKIGPKLGMPNLYIAFGGWYPGRNATLPTATFTDLQAAAAFGRIADDDARTLVVASAGHSAASFASVATAFSYRLLLVLNGAGLKRLSTLARVGPTVQTILVADGSLEDLRACARGIAENPDYINEGGVANIARRDGAGTLLLSAVETMGTLPEVYIQAANDGIGVLGSYEAALRLLGDGQFGSVLPKFVIGQNAPNAPIHDAWSRNAPKLLPSKLEGAEIPKLVTMMTSRQPPYDVRGGLFDMLIASGGATFAIENEEIAAASRAFMDYEQIDIDNESAVAVASLIRALRARTILPTQSVLLGITAGGRGLLRQDPKIFRPTIAVTRATEPAAMLEQLRLRAVPPNLGNVSRA